MIEHFDARRAELCTRGRLRLAAALLLFGLSACGSSKTDQPGDGTAGTGSGGTSAGSGGQGGSSAGSAGSSGAADCMGSTPCAAVGWAAVSAAGVMGTTGGDGGRVVVVSTLAALNAAADGSLATIIQVQGQISGDVTVGSNKTIEGLGGATIQGHIQVSRSVNVIVRNLNIVGNNCTDSPDDCSGGADAVTIENGAHHIWFDHDDISDGSDGNLDVTTGSDYVTISWTKFHYTARRTDPAGAGGGHEFSNLIGGSDTETGDATHLKVTFHHDWWANNVFERMPRVRFGQVHLFDNLYTAEGNQYCIGVGANANILTENNVFQNVDNPIDSTDYSNAMSVVHSVGNLYQGTTGATRDLGTGVFTPPYAYTLEPAAGVAAAVMNGAGPQ